MHDHVHCNPYHDDSICKILCLRCISHAELVHTWDERARAATRVALKPVRQPVQCSGTVVVYVCTCVSSDLFNFTGAERARVGNLRYFALLTVFLCSSLNLNSFTSLCLSSVLGYCLPGDLSGQVAAVGQTTYRQISHPYQITRGELHFCDRVSACLRCILSLIS